MESIHKQLWRCCRELPTDFEPYGERSREEDFALDCSCGCRFFFPLQDAPSDWGVCGNPESPRVGLLTFEHQGCRKFEHDPADLE